LARIPSYYAWHKWTNKDIITAGVDVGSVGSKAVIMVNGQAYSYSIFGQVQTVLKAPPKL